MQAFELAGDFAQRLVRVRGMDAGHQSHQPVFGQAGRGLPDQAGIGEVLGDKPLHSAAEAFRRPVKTALLQHAGNVVPGVVGPHPPHRRRI